MTSFDRAWTRLEPGAVGGLAVEKAAHNRPPRVCAMRSRTNSEPVRSKMVVVSPQPKEVFAMIFRKTLVTTILLAGTAVASAQTVVVTPEQETVVREYVTTHPVEVERPSNFELVVGAIIPDILKPGELAENTLDNNYQYVVMDGRTVLIEPETRKVIHIID
jgi:hypothetical protein